MHPKLIDTQTGQTSAICVDCGDAFQRSDAEIKARRGSGMPVSARCPACRVARREEHNARILDSLRHGDLRESQRPSVGPVDGAQRLYSADCSGCRRPIRLPFKPRLDRPVFCRFCHDIRGGR